MTGYARSQIEDRGYRITVELRSVNSRNLDVVLRFPKNYLELEDPARKQIARRLLRGRVEAFIQIEPALAEKKAARINFAVAKHYWEQLLELRRQLAVAEAPGFEHLLRCPDLYETPEEDTDRAVIEEILTATMADALANLGRMKMEEGRALLQDLLPRLQVLEVELDGVAEHKHLVVSDYRQRIQERLQDLLGNVALDEARLLQEIAILAERSDITEEIVRTRSHIEQLRALLTGSEAAVGRKLDFLVQELHREVNTIGSKASDLKIAQAVVTMKNEIAKLREQVQNIE
jgi:uncharacterized protein (TIGR00255 family)